MKSIEEAFRESKQISRKFNEEVHRCSLKGWSDRKRELDVAFELQELLILDRELKFQHLLQTGEIGRQEWHSMMDIMKRLSEGWTEAEDAVLKNENPRYAEVSEKIEQIGRALDADAIDGPLQDMRRDPEYKHALKRYIQALKELDAQLG